MVWKSGIGVAILEVNNRTVCDKVKIDEEWEVYPGKAATKKASNFAAAWLPLKEIKKPKHTVPWWERSWAID